ncbi:hypothetical protein [Pseudanabaena mucicola]|uniref:VCBS repeat-containing protein n=1 Tax=Pseudanabaena mucicola FACHB-723 TaxID=2692860 RepID=A0ABR7ZZQ9_9CYAN|nr:hypothetical protein [Pseudanabaena mucicola]MBD2188776.1 hypothetical protein [Pseudanabaena mucicola FACHB-723]
MLFRQFTKQFQRFLSIASVLIIAIAVNACNSDNQSKPNQETASSQAIPVFLLLQSSPDGKTIEGVVPSDLVEQLGSLDRVVKSIPAGSNFTLTQFGKPLGTFAISEVKGSETFGAIASFKVQTPPEKNQDQSGNPSTKSIDSEILRQTNLTIVASDQIDPSGDRNYFFNCPSKIQPLVLAKSRNLFVKLGANQESTSQIAIASLTCADLDSDNQPEIIAGLRLDNAIRPVGFDTQAWQEFLSLPALKRQEYSMLVMLRRAADNDWVAEPILTHTRALSYINDSVSSYALFGIQSLNGDRYPEIVVQEIGLNSIDVHVFTPSVDAVGKWQWRSYYRNQRSLNIFQ